MNDELAEALIRTALVGNRDAHMRLIRDTHEMLEANAEVEDVVWMLSPDPLTWIADRRQELTKDAPPLFRDMMRNLPPRVKGRMIVVYIGPEGACCQRWESILTAPKATA